MCSVDSCSDVLLEKKLNLTGAFCRKCEGNAARVVLQGKFPYCRECFLTYFKHKYSGGIGKEKVLRPWDTVLVAFSGSFPSLCLLNLIHASLVEERKKKTIFKVVLLFIDERVHIPKEERKYVFDCLSEMTSGYGYKLYFTRLYSPGTADFLLSEDPEDILTLDDEPLSSLLDDFTSTTARKDFIEKLRIQKFLEAARKLGCTKIFTAETSDHIAARIISNVAIARGKTLSSDTGFIDRLCDKISLVRPLRECSKKEVTFYNVFYGLHKYKFPWILEVDKFSSIQKLTEVFLSELAESFPSTVATVSSTGGKLCSEESQCGVCLFCRSTLSQSKDLNAAEAMKISQLVTKLGPKNFDPVIFSSLENGEEVSGGSSPSSNHRVCYPCSILIRENKKELLLSWVKSQEVLRQEMHDEIKDFLIT